MYKIICNTKIKGIPIVNFGCMVLWWKYFMPVIEPMEPPIKAMAKRKLSEIRHL